MSEGARGNRKLILILSALLAAMRRRLRAGRTMSRGRTRPRPRRRRRRRLRLGQSGRRGRERSAIMPARRRSAAQRSGREPPAADRPDARRRGIAARLRRRGALLRHRRARAIRRGRGNAPSPSSRADPVARALRRAGDADDDLRQRRRRAPQPRCRHPPRLQASRALAPAEYDRAGHPSRPAARRALARAATSHYCDDITGGLADGRVRGAPRRAGPAAARGGHAGADRALDARGTGGLRAASARLRGVRRGLGRGRSGRGTRAARCGTGSSRACATSSPTCCSGFRAGPRAALHRRPVPHRGSAAQPGLSRAARRRAAI